jgi:hypothetical protein
MRTTLWIVSLIVLAGKAGGVRSWDFHTLAPGSLPEAWKAEATGQEKATAKWQVAWDERHHGRVS